MNAFIERWELHNASTAISLTPHVPACRCTESTLFWCASRVPFAHGLQGGIVAMDRGKSGCALLVLLAATGCRMCNHCSDYAPVVIDGPYSHVSGRAGSVLSGSPMPLPGLVTEQPQKAPPMTEE
jgi:hypothetical protein